jgi:outer membrane protein assembly factor BamB
MRNLSLLTLFIPVLFGCQKPEPCDNCSGNPPTPSDKDSLVVLWQIPINKDTAECVSMKPFVFNDQVLFSDLFYVDGFESLYMVDAKTGALKWKWDPTWPGETLSRGSRFAKDNLFFLTHWGPSYGIDMNTGQNIWENNINSPTNTGSPRMNLVGNYLYTEHSAKILKDTASYYVRADIYSGKWDTLFVIKAEEEYRPNLFPPTLWIDPNNDSILIFQNRQWNFPASDGRVDLLAYNLNTRQFIWETKDFDPVGNSSVEQLMVYDNKVYLIAERRLYCFDAFTGAVKWHWDVFEPSDNLLFTNLVVAEGKIFIKPTNDKRLYGLDPETGLLVFNMQVGSGSVNMTYYNGIIYYASEGNGYVYAIKPSTKEIIWNYGPPNRYNHGKGAGNAIFDQLTVSPEHNCVFISDRYYFMAIKLPE